MSKMGPPESKLNMKQLEFDRSWITYICVLHIFTKPEASLPPTISCLPLTNEFFCFSTKSLLCFCSTYIIGYYSGDNCQGCNNESISNLSEALDSNLLCSLAAISKLPGFCCTCALNKAKIRLNCRRP